MFDRLCSIVYVRPLMFDRKLPVKLSRWVWNMLKAYWDQGRARRGLGGVHTFGEFQQFNPHLYVIDADSCFLGYQARPPP